VLLEVEVPESEKGGYPKSLICLLLSASGCTQVYDFISCDCGIHCLSECETDSGEISPTREALLAASHVIVFDTGHQREVVTVNVVIQA
jgi:hypothetical protein